MEGHHNIIVIVGAGTVAILVILVLVQTSYMIKLSKEFKKKDLEADKKIKEMKEKWSKLEVAINSLVQEINQARTRTQVNATAPKRCHQVPSDECMGSFQRNRTISASVRNILPLYNSKILSIKH